MTDSDGACVKDVRKIDVPVDKLNLPISVDSDVSYTKSFHLVGYIVHSGTMQRGHYTAYVKERDKSSWLLCNDKAVIHIEGDLKDSEMSYVLFYESS